MKFSKKQEGPFVSIKSTRPPVETLLDRESKSFASEWLSQVDQKDSVCVSKSAA